MNSLFMLVVACMVVVSVLSFHLSSSSSIGSKLRKDTVMSLNQLADFIPTEVLQQKGMMLLADTSVSEEEILSVAGQTTDLPDPLFAVGVAAFIFLGVAVLQFSLGDLTKEVRSCLINYYLSSENNGLLFCYNSYSYYFISLSNAYFLIIVVSFCF